MKRLNFLDGVGPENKSVSNDSNVSIIERTVNKQPSKQELRRLLSMYELAIEEKDMLATNWQKLDDATLNSLAIFLNGLNQEIDTYKNKPVKDYLASQAQLSQVSVIRILAEDIDNKFPLLDFNGVDTADYPDSKLGVEFAANNNRKIMVERLVEKLLSQIDSIKSSKKNDTDAGTLKEQEINGEPHGKDGRAYERSGSSPLSPGGIDFRAMNYLVQPMGSFKDLRFGLPILTISALERIDLDKELASLRDMVKAGMVPSGERVKEYLAACFQKGKIEEKQDDLLVCLAEIYRLAEDENLETSPELRESLVIVDTGKFVLLPNSQKAGLN